MVDLDNTQDVDFNSFHKTPKKIPFDVFYQTLKSDSFGEHGYLFNVYNPGGNYYCLLHRDIWVEYTFAIIDNTDYAISSTFETPPLVVRNNAVGPVAIPNSPVKIALRSGNVISRVTESLQVQINNHTITYLPNKYIEVFNRLYVSNTQAEHEFSASGGRFDEGNHGARTDNVVYFTRPGDNPNNMVPDTFAIVNDEAVDETNTYLDIYLHTGWTMQGTSTVSDNQDFVNNMRSVYPVKYPFYNPGFSSRVDNFAAKCRQDYSEFKTDTGADAGVQFRGSTEQVVDVDDVRQIWFITVRERLPCPIFKMYTTDNQYGVLPGIRHMQLKGRFCSNFLPNVFRISPAQAIEDPFSMYWEATHYQTNAKLYLRWYSPNQSIPIPKEVKLNAPRIDTYNRNITASNSMDDANGASYIDTDINERDITLLAVPDLILVYIKYRADSYTQDTPDDYNLELIDINIKLNNSAGKLNGASSILQYQNWRDTLHHNDSHVITFDEWRKYCFVSVLKVEDYGLKTTAGENRSVNMAITCTARNWYLNPSIAVQPDEALGGELGAGTALELCVTSIFNRNKLVIKGDYNVDEILENL